MTSGEALAGILGVAGLKQVDLANRAGVSPKHVNQLIKGHVRLSADVAVKLSDAICEHLMALETQGQIAKARNR